MSRLSNKEFLKKKKVHYLIFSPFLWSVSIWASQMKRMFVKLVSHLPLTVVSVSSRSTHCLCFVANTSMDLFERPFIAPCGCFSLRRFVAACFCHYLSVSLAPENDIFRCIYVAHQHSKSRDCLCLSMRWECIHLACFCIDFSSMLDIANQIRQRVFLFRFS